MKMNLRNIILYCDNNTCGLCKFYDRGGLIYAMLE
jgi:hypothetical protein